MRSGVGGADENKFRSLNGMEKQAVIGPDSINQHDVWLGRVARASWKKRAVLAGWDQRIVGFMQPRAAAAVAQKAWYLSVIGVTPSARGQGIGKRLLEPTLAEADNACVDCYLETFDGRNPRFYERIGFLALESHAEPTTSASYTIMLRRPKARAAHS